MISTILKSLTVSSLLLASATALAQETGGNVVTGGNNAGSGSLGSGSGSFGIDFFAGSSVSGSNYEKTGGLASSLEKAFGGIKQNASATCGKLKCD